MRYGDASGDVFNVAGELGLCHPSERVIYLSPELRLKKHREFVWTIFAHEVLHAIDETMIRRRQRRRGWRSPSHAEIERLSVPLGSFLAGVLGAGKVLA